MKLSIITINYNNAADLQKTIESVLKQTWQQFEFIVIDGGSTDSSVEVIRQSENFLTHWVSEKDKGVFNAMNKGINKARGEYLLMLNAGDFLCDEQVLERVFGSGIYKEDILSGDVYRATNGKIFEKSYFPDKLTFNLFRNGSLSHQGTFIKRELHNKIGLYDENLKFSADWKFFILAICKHNVSYKHLPFFISVCDCGGLTCNPANFAAMKSESDKTLKEHFSTFISDYERLDQMNSKSISYKISATSHRIKGYFKKYAKKGLEA